MKTINKILLAAALATGKFTATAQPTNVPPPPPEKSAPAEVKADEPLATNAPAMTSTGGTNGLRLNFSNVPLELVLKYLSDAAGFHIVMDTQVKGSVTVISSHAMSKDEAVILLNTVLNKNGYAAIRNEQFLTIVDKADAKNRNIPVIVQSDPALVPNNDIIVTQIIPLRFVEAAQLVKDLSPFVAQTATIVANEAGNSIVITDTQANIRHLCEIIKAIDSSAEASTEIRVFHLQHANPSDVATLLGGVFPSQSSGSGSQTPVRFGGGGGPGGFFQRMMGGGGGQGGQGGDSGGGSGGSSNDRIRKQTQVVAVADLRTSSVVVTAQKDLMEQIAGMIEQIDVASTRDQKVFVYHLDHGDPQQAATVLQGMFQSSGTSRSGTSSSQTSALQSRETQNANSMGSSSSSSSSSSLGGGRTGGGTGGGRGGF